MPDSVLIRRFEAADQDTARRLILTGMGEHWGFIDETCNPDIDDIQTNYIERGATFIVACLAGQIVGTCALVPECEKECRIVRMSVASSARRHGIGRTLVDHLLIRARQRGFHRVLVETTDTWEDAIGFYRAYGFEVFAHHAGEIHLKLELTGSQQ